MESAPGWGVEAAWWGDDAVLTRPGGLYKGYMRYNWRVVCFTYVQLNKAILNLRLNPQIRRARDALGLWGPHGAGKAVRVGFLGSSICAGVTKSAGLRAAQ